MVAINKVLGSTGTHFMHMRVKEQTLIIFRILFYLVVVKISHYTYILVILLHDQVILANLWLNLNLNFKRFLSMVGNFDGSNQLGME